MRYIASAVMYLKKQFGPLILGVLLGVTLFGAMVSDSTDGGPEGLLFVPVVAVLLVIMIVLGLSLSMIGYRPGPGFDSKDEDDNWIVAFTLGVAVGSGVALGVVENPLFGFLWAIGLFFCTLVIIGVLIGLLLALVFLSFHTGKLWNWSLRRW